jgi:benzoate transport
MNELAAHAAPSAAGASGAPATDVRRLLDDGPMSRFQVGAVAVCVILNMLDGFDVLVMAFTATSVQAEWQLSGAQLGVLLSAGLVGMACGSLFVAPWADRFGRRTIILLCLALMTLGMLLSAIAQNMPQLWALRVVTGLGIGGMLASIGVITAEYSSSRWRSTNVSIQATGYPIGATIGGIIAAVLIAQLGWRAAFAFGGIVSALMVPLVLRQLPESLDFLLVRQPSDALSRINALLRRMGRATVDRMPARTAADALAVSSNPVRGLFAGAAATRATLLLWGAFFLLMFSFYFVMSWTPRLLVAAGLSPTQGITGGVVLNLGGIFGGALFALLASRTSVRGLTAAFLAVTGLTVAVFGFIADDLAIAFTVALAIGMCLVGSMAGLYSLAPIIYPANVRTTGLGWGIGIGRIGAVLAPMIAGLLVDAGWSTPYLYGAFALPLVAAVIVTGALRSG